MAGFKDITGQRFGRWTVTGRAPNKGTHTHWYCRCECGTSKSVSSNNLRNGLSVSCGCYKEEIRSIRCTKHGLAGTKEYTAWLDAKRRCFKKDHRQYPDYGGRGITMSPEWSNSVEKFFADMGPCPEGLELDRINNDGNYEDGNCRWTDRATQLGNTRRSVKITHNGETLSLKQWSLKTGIPFAALSSRYYGNVDVPLFAPSRRRARKYKDGK